MKSFRFTLESVLRLRQLDEEKGKLRLGELLSQKKAEQDIINKAKSSISHLDEQFGYSQGLIQAGPASAIPELVIGQKGIISSSLSKLSELDDLIQKEQAGLAILRGRVKVLEDLQEKEKKIFRKKILNIEETEQEEAYQAYVQFQRRDL